jgi:ATP phosphoribosyltransferase
MGNCGPYLFCVSFDGDSEYNSKSDCKGIMEAKQMKFNQIPKYKSRDIRLAIPSKGRMELETELFLKSCGFNLQRKKRQYIGFIQEPINIKLVYQRQLDIIQGILNGSLELGIVGYDLVLENLPSSNHELIVIHDALNFGKCNLEIAIPEDWLENSIEEIEQREISIRIATKFSNLTKKFLDKYDISYKLINGNGSLEVYPELDYSDIIVDLVSTGQTLKDNRLKQIQGGKIISSQAVLIGNKTALKSDPVLALTRELLEYIEATLRAQNFVSLFVNMRGKNSDEIAQAIFSKKGLEGLQGPTISPVYTKDGEKMFAVHVIVEKIRLQQAINNLRAIGGSGVVVAPTLYIFEKEPQSYRQLKMELGMVNG